METVDSLHFYRLHPFLCGLRSLRSDKEDTFKRTTGNEGEDDAETKGNEEKIFKETKGTEFEDDVQIDQEFGCLKERLLSSCGRTSRFEGFTVALNNSKFNVNFMMRSC